MKKPVHGGARKDAGRPRAADKTDHVVAFRLTSAEFEAATKAAAKHTSVNALAKALLMKELAR